MQPYSTKDTGLTDKAAVRNASGTFGILWVAYAFSQMDLALFGYALPVIRAEWGLSLGDLRWILFFSFSLGGVLLVWWLMALASGPEYFAFVQALLASSIGRLMLLGWTWAMFYHLCNGIRHLFWDVGLGYEITTARLTGWCVLLASFALTGAAWVVGILSLGRIS